MSAPAASPSAYLDKLDPAAYRALTALSATVRESAADAGLERTLVELVNIRVSQINGCAFCLDLHVRAALRDGESVQRLAVLPAWRDASLLFTEREQAALAVAEAATLLPDGGWRKAEAERASDVLTTAELSAVNWVAITMNAFNRVSILSRHPVRVRHPT
jgi:AhpD family alkylhydroperoxidase